MRHDALHDALTGLPNRTLLLDRLAPGARARRPRRQPRRRSLPRPRQPQGAQRLARRTAPGDELLRAIGPRMRGELRAADTVARFGGDEFAIVCEDIDDADHGGDDRPAARASLRGPVRGRRRGALRLCQRRRRRGPARSAPRGAEELLSDADAAMYRAKERGRGRFEMFDAGLRDRITARLQMEADLRRALEGEGRCGSPTSPTTACRAASSPASRRSCAGTTPSAAASRPPSSSPSPRRAASWSRSAPACCAPPASRSPSWQRETGHHGLRLTVNVSARQMATPGLRRHRPGRVLRQTACTRTRSASRSPSVCCSRRRPARR